MTTSGEPETITFAAAARALTARVWRPAADPLATAVVQVHGGAWRGGSPDDLATRSQALCRLGFTCVAIEYRSIGEAAWPAPLDDVMAALRWVSGAARRLGVDPARTVLQGYSAGAHLALVAAGRSVAEGSLTPPPAAVMALYPPAVLYSTPASGAGGPPYRLAADRADLDLRRWAGQLRSDGIPGWLLLADADTEDNCAQASPVSHIGGAFPPTFLVHGADDAVIPSGSSIRLYDALTRAGVPADLHLFAGEVHEFDSVSPWLDVVASEAALFFRRTAVEPARLAAAQLRSNHLAAAQQEAGTSPPSV